MPILQFSDEVALTVRRGLATALPGRRWHHVRRTVRYRVQTAGRAVCGLLATQTMLDQIDRMRVGDRLGARGRVGLMRLGIKLVAMGPHDRCACERCRDHRALMRRCEKR